MDAHDGQVDVVEELVVELDAHAGGEEDHDLLLAVLLQEGEEEEQPLLRGADHVALLQAGDGGHAALVLVLQPDVDRLLLEGHADEVLRLLRRRRTEQHRLPFLCKSQI